MPHTNAAPNPRAPAPATLPDRVPASSGFREVLTSLALVSWPDLDTALGEICRAAADAMHVARVSVWRYDRTRASMHSSNAWNNGIPNWQSYVINATTHPSYWQALHASRVLAISSASNDPVLAELREEYIEPLGIGAMLDSGVRAEQQTLGIVCFEHVGGSREWTTAEQEFAASVADRVGLALALDEHRRLESDLRQMQKMEAIGLLAGGVAHDFNNVLSVILASTELVRDGIARGSDVSVDLHAITDVAKRAAGLTRKLLFIARRETMEREMLDLNEVARGFLAMAHSIVRMQARVRLDLCAEPLPIHVDRAFLDQALLNLVTNAAQAMPAGGTLTFESALLSNVASVMAYGTSLPQGVFARLTVRDTGKGIPREELSHIFEPFYTTKGEHGTGLGLAVVYGGMRQHDGHIAVESEPGRGTAFHLLFPVVR